MDKEQGLPSLPDKCVDLCLTDPPFNINYKAKFTELNYKDNKNDYKEWCEIWFNELKRICNGIILYVGQTEFIWDSIELPNDRVYLFKPNSQSGRKKAYLRRVYPIYIYGKCNKLKEDYFNYWARNGFLREGYLHPCPLIEDFWEDLITQLKPISVIDPFLGSGTTAEVCTKLGIKWLGYEINEVYSQDINKRLLNCKKEPQQIALERYIK